MVKNPQFHVGLFFHSKCLPRTLMGHRSLGHVRFCVPTNKLGAHPFASQAKEKQHIQKKREKEEEEDEVEETTEGESKRGFFFGQKANQYIPQRELAQTISISIDDKAFNISLLLKHMQAVKNQVLAFAASGLLSSSAIVLLQGGAYPLELNIVMTKIPWICLTTYWYYIWHSTRTTLSNPSHPIRYVDVDEMRDMYGNVLTTRKKRLYSQCIDLKTKETQSHNLPILRTCVDKIDLANKGLYLSLGVNVALVFATGMINPFGTPSIAALDVEDVVARSLYPSLMYFYTFLVKFAVVSDFVKFCFAQCLCFFCRTISVNMDMTVVENRKVKDVEDTLEEGEN
ncbi:hypothetical protein RFI_02653 [Reticulomyxa filosa]|uniref:Uncharacterized protein n=1 Tax=Reticulomyxa filosa TaxID=46433 RepID=X6P8Q8_RETFI|nr:hypothetical protein RFI_02653 [Reticulomyxa filosa]|eukprot:ETO34439.1 hypothetical protein RFI_02653 [Reticulomyxa filosa]